MSDVATKPAPNSPAVIASSESNATGGNRRQLDFRWFFGAYAVSIFGDQITLVAMPLVVFARTHSAFAVGIAASMQATSMLVLGLFAGALADRLRHRPVLIATDVLRGAVLGLVALMVATSSTYPVGALYLAAFVLGALGVLHDAAAGATLPVIVGGRELLMANGRLSGAEMAGNAGGPAVAGVLIAFGGAALAFAGDALTFLLSAFGIHQVRALRRRDERPSDAQPASMTADIREGLRALWADGIVVKAVVLMAILNVAIVPVEAQFIPYAKTVLHTGAAGIGAYFAIGGVAGVVTAALLGR